MRNAPDVRQRKESNAADQSTNNDKRPATTTHKPDIIAQQAHDDLTKDARNGSGQPNKGHIVNVQMIFIGKYPAQRGNLSG